MNILALDSCSKSISCAIESDGIILGEFYLELPIKHSITLLQTIDKLLNSCGIDVSDIDCFACTAGPGSFTGQRIGIAAILGLADTQKKQVMGISTLEVLALNVPLLDLLISPILDARNNQVYTALYRSESDNFIEVESPIAMSIDEWLEVLKKCQEKIIFVGDIEPFKEKIRRVLGEYAIFSTDNLIIASNVARIASKNPEKWVSTSELRPIYLRKCQAEQKIKAKAESKLPLTES